jgi:hypothetical protein
MEPPRHQLESFLVALATILLASIVALVPVNAFEMIRPDGGESRSTKRRTGAHPLLAMGSGIPRRRDRQPALRPAGARLTSSQGQVIGLVSSSTAPPFSVTSCATS